MDDKIPFYALDLRNISRLVKTKTKTRAQCLMVNTGSLKRHQLNKYLKSSWAPIHELNGSLGLDCGNGCIHVLWYHISTEQQTAGHVFAMAWVTFYHLIGWLKAGIGDFSNCKLFMVGFLGRDDWSISSQWEVNTWIRHQVGLQ